METASAERRIKEFEQNEDRITRDKEFSRFQARGG